MGDDSSHTASESFDGCETRRGGNMIAAVIVAWLLLNVAIAGWLTWVRIVRPDREKLQRERERQSIGAGFPLARRRKARTELRPAQSS